MRIAKNGQLIASVDDWFRHAPPKGGADHWRDGRSAKELARAWIESGSVAVPNELSALLASHPDTRSAVLESAEPEARIAFDRHRGEARNADLAVRAVLDGVPLAITKLRPTSLSISWFPTPSPMRSIACSSAVAAQASTACAISRPPCYRLPVEGYLRFVSCATSC